MNKAKKIYKMNVDGKVFELKISDFVLGQEGWFSVKVWENEKKIFVPPIIEFSTFADPFVVAEQQIRTYIKKKEKYLQILERLENAP